MITDATIYWGLRGFRTSGVPAGIYKRAFLQILEDGDLLVDNIGQVVAALAIEFRAAGLAVRVAVDPSYLLRHKGCGQLYDHVDWLALPALEMVCPSAVDPGAAGWFECRTCGCGSTITYASLELVSAGELMAGKGGVA